MSGNAELRSQASTVHHSVRIMQYLSNDVMHNAIDAYNGLCLHIVHVGANFGINEEKSQEQFSMTMFFKTYAPANPSTLVSLQRHVFAVSPEKIYREY
ncbi:hypothetical protein T02_1622 [Trichinella nativa]|uniref:Uncharacterized protein n=1 Tax=Trichinella nativa TaxID=6335 RepID=A0A0V1LVM3_9BILA|nr:hypothetical protein T02_1622 [Trichinella nativa]